MYIRIKKLHRAHLQSINTHLQCVVVALVIHRLELGVRRRRRLGVTRRLTAVHAHRAVTSCNKHQTVSIIKCKGRSLHTRATCHSPCVLVKRTCAVQNIDAQTLQLLFLSTYYSSG